MDRAYEFRIYPDRQQRQLIAKTFGCCRLVYNHYLAERKRRYEASRIALSYTDCAKGLDVRKWFCDCCLEHHDRDVNAAVNIREEGRDLLKKKMRESA